MWIQLQLLQLVPPHKLFHSHPPSNHTKIPCFAKLNSTPNTKIHYGIRNPKITLEELPPNALRMKREAEWIGGFSLGVDLGMSRTGIALSKGFVFRPLTVSISTLCCYSNIYCCYVGFVVVQFPLNIWMKWGFIMYVIWYITVVYLFILLIDLENVGIRLSCFLVEGNCTHTM